MKRSFKIHCSFLIIPILFLLAVNYAFADSDLKAAYTEWYPYTYQTDGKALGFEIEIFDAVIHKMGLKAEFKVYPWKRCLANLESGVSDVLISMLKTPEREIYTYYPDENISISKTAFFIKTDNDVQYEGSLNKLRDLSVGYISGFSYGEQFDKATYLKKDPAINPTILINKLLAGRNDVAAENQTVIEGYASKMGVINKIRFLSPPIHTQKLYVGFSKSAGLKLCNDFSKALANFKKTEDYMSILKKYNVLKSQHLVSSN